MRNWVFVKVLTDQPGLCGWGEATLEWHARWLGPWRIWRRSSLGGPHRVEHLWQMMFRQHFCSNGIVRGTAISGIDLALWDILGKLHGSRVTETGRASAGLRAPLPSRWRKDGGVLRDRIGGCSPVRQLQPSSRPRRIHRLQGDGGAGDDASRGAPAAPLRGGVRGGDALRWGMRSTSWSTATPGLRRRWGCASRTLWSRRRLFLEEPCWPETLDDIALIQRSVTTPIATGERLVSSTRSKLLEKRACRVLQPDITHCGGLSEARRIAAMAEAYKVALAPHNPRGPVSTAASLEFGFATPSCVICESVHRDVPWRGEVVSLRSTSSRRRVASSAPRAAPGWGSRSTRRRSRPSVPAGRVAAEASTRTWRTGERE